MGIKNLMKIIKKFAPECIIEKSILDYENKILSIDANLLIYRSVLGVQKHGSDIINVDKPVTHLHTLISKISGFLKYNITPIFVFDGHFPLIKDQTIKNRSEYKKEMVKKFNAATTTKDKVKYFVRKSRVTTAQFNECKTLIKLCGLPIIEAKGEADVVCAYLSHINLVSDVVSDDMDLLLFGAKSMLKNFSIDKKKKFQEINLKKLLNKLQFTQSQLIELGICLGTDYNKPIEDVGILGAYKLLNKYSSIASMIKNNICKVDFDYNAVHDYFKINKSELKKMKFTKKNIDYDGLRKFLYEMKFSTEYIDKKILSLKNEINIKPNK
jgi:flap endonuclease-1